MIDRFTSGAKPESETTAPADAGEAPAREALFTIVAMDEWLEDLVRSRCCVPAQDRDILP
jgi:hypothetical protein